MTDTISNNISGDSSYKLHPQFVGARSGPDLYALRMAALQSASRWEADPKIALSVAKLFYAFLIGETDEPR